MAWDFAATLVHEQHVRTFVVRTTAHVGWEALESIDDQVIHRRACSDWHRVERLLSRYTQEIAELREQGWSDRVRLDSDLFAAARHAGGRPQRVL